MEPSHKLIELTAGIVSAYVGKNPVSQADLPKLISDTFQSLQNVMRNGGRAPERDATPAVDVVASVTPDFIVCLEDGKKFKSLKRHIRAHYNLSPDEYRAKWNLPPDYPMVAPNYAEERSSLAKRMRLGHHRNR